MVGYPHTPDSQSGEWIGIFRDTCTDDPIVVCLMSEEFQPCLGYYNIEIPGKTSIYTPNYAAIPYLSIMLEEVRKLTITMGTNGNDMVNQYKGMIRRVCTTLVEKGPKKKEMLFYYEMMDK